MSNYRDKDKFDYREKGFSTYFQGANRDEREKLGEKNVLNQREPKRRSKGWGAPVSTILGRKVQNKEKNDRSDQENDQENDQGNEVQGNQMANSYPTIIRNLNMNQIMDSSSQDFEVLNQREKIMEEYDSNFALRIKLLNGWKKNKYISLKKIHLQVEIVSKDDESILYVRDVDLLKTINNPNDEEKCETNFEITISKDMACLPRSDELYKSINTLFESSNSISNLSRSSKVFDDEKDKHWICPISNHIGASIEINITGSLYALLTQMYEEVFKSDDSRNFYFRMNLKIWNGLEGNLISPVKDVTIFFNGKCSFSGELVFNPASSLFPSFQLFLGLSKQTAMNSISENSNNFKVLSDEDANTPLTIFTESNQHSSAKINEMREIAKNSLKELRTSSISLPNDIFISNNDTSISQRPVSSRRSSRVTNDVNLSNKGIPENQTMSNSNAIAANEFGNCLKATVFEGSRRGSRRLSGQIGQIEQIINKSESNNILAHVHSSSLLPSAKIVLDSSSATLSLACTDSIDFSLLKPSSCKPCIIEVEKLQQQNNFPPSSNNVSSLEDFALNYKIQNPDTSNKNIINNATCVEIGENVSSNIFVNSSSNLNRLKQRAEKVNQVNETVLTAVETISEIVNSSRNLVSNSTSHSQTSLKSQEDDIWSDEVEDLQSDKNQFKDTVDSVNLNQNLLENIYSSDIFKPPYGLPCGTHLLFCIYSTWGDEFYVGLNGIEIYNHEGEIVENIQEIKQKQLSKCRTDLCDQRKIKNLLDGVNTTHDDDHLWLTPIDSEKDLILASFEIEFKDPTFLAMIRIFNFNKSRTHSFRGVKECQILLDNKILFKGHLKQASGFVNEFGVIDEISHEIKFFSNNSSFQSNETISKIEFGIQHHDSIAGYRNKEEVIREKDDISSFVERPSTSESRKNSIVHLIQSNKQSVPSEFSFDPSVVKIPKNAPTSISLKSLGLGTSLRDSSSLQRLGTIKEFESEYNQKTSILYEKNEKSKLPIVEENSFCKESINRENIIKSFELTEKDLITGHKISFNLLDTWGDDMLIGLTGLEILCGTNMRVLNTKTRQLRTEPRDMTSLGYFDDTRVFSNILTTVNNTTDDKHMWLAPFTPGSKHEVEITLDSPEDLAGFRIWNFNSCVRSSEGKIYSGGLLSDELIKGVRRIRVIIDNSIVLGEWEIRMAPGCDGIDFSQTCLFRKYLNHNSFYYPGILSSSSLIKLNKIKENRELQSNSFLRQDYEPIPYPTGLLWTFTFYNNYGDPYYIGLDCIEFYDANGLLIEVNKSYFKIAAIPNSINCLSSIIDKSKNQDPRTPDKVFIPISPLKNHMKSSQRSSWLSPLSRCMTEEEKSKSGEIFQQGQNCFPPDNTLYFMCDYPITISYIRVFNYSKTPVRGVRDLSITVDGKLIFMGILMSADQEKPSDNMREGQIISFTNDANILKDISKAMNYCGSNEQDILFINERKVMIKSKSMFDRPDVSSEGVSVDISQRPTTSFV